MLRVLLAVVLLGGLAQAGDLSDLDRSNGFLNLQFGDRREEHNGLIEVRDFGAIRLYVDVVDRKSFRGAALEGIGYLFYGSQLFAVVLSPFRERDADKLLRVFTEQYGEPYEASTNPEWWGQRVGIQWMPNPDGGPAYAVILDRQVVHSIESLGTQPFDILYRLD